MIDLEKVINELCFQLNSKEVKEHHYPVQLSVRDAEKILALLKEHKNEYEKGFNDAMQGKQELMYEGIDGKWYKKDW